MTTQTTSQMVKEALEIEDGRLNREVTKLALKWKGEHPGPAKDKLHKELMDTIFRSHLLRMLMGTAYEL